MRSVESLRREVKNLKKRIPATDFEFEVLGIDDEVPDGDDVIVLDIVGALSTLRNEGNDDYE